MPTRPKTDHELCICGRGPAEYLIRLDAHGGPVYVCWYCLLESDHAQVEGEDE